MTRTVQYFSNEYLQSCQQMTSGQICQFLDDFRKLHGSPKQVKAKPPSKLISLKVDNDLLEEFREKCEISGLRYQTQIKTLMADWCN